MSDLIFRQAAIDALNGYFSRIGKLKRRGLTEAEKAISLDTVGTIKTLPSAQPEQRWIPVSERFPEKYGKVLVTFVPSGGTLWTMVRIAHYSDLMGISNPCFWVGEVGKNSFENISDHVIAWMPLPEAYRKGKNGTACKEKM